MYSMKNLLLLSHQIYKLSYIKPGETHKLRVSMIVFVYQVFIYNEKAVCATPNIYEVNKEGNSHLCNVGLLLVQ